MMNKAMRRIIHRENNALMTFFEENAIQNRIPLDLCFHTMIETFWIVAEESYRESQITITFKAIPKNINDILNSSLENICPQMNLNDLERKIIEMDFDDHCCQECVHLYFDNSCQKCIYQQRTAQLHNNPHNHKIQWFCPYFENQNYDINIIDVLYNLWERGNNADR